MKAQLIQALENAGYRIVRREALAPNLLAIEQTELAYEPLAFNRVRKIHSFIVWARAHTPDEAITKADEIMNVIWQAFEEINEISAEFSNEIFRIIVTIPEG